MFMPMTNSFRARIWMWLTPPILNIDRLHGFPLARNWLHCGLWTPGQTDLTSTWEISTTRRTAKTMGLRVVWKKPLTTLILIECNWSITANTQQETMSLVCFKWASHKVKMSISSSDWNGRGMLSFADGKRAEVEPLGTWRSWNSTMKSFPDNAHCSRSFWVLVVCAARSYSGDHSEGEDNWNSQPSEQNWLKICLLKQFCSLGKLSDILQPTSKQPTLLCYYSIAFKLWVFASK